MMIYDYLPKAVSLVLRRTVINEVPIFHSCCAHTQGALRNLQRSSMIFTIGTLEMALKSKPPTSDLNDLTIRPRLRKDYFITLPAE